MDLEHLKKFFKTVPRDEARVLAVAKALSQNNELAERYRSAIARLPKDKDRWEIDPQDEALINSYAVLQ